MTPEQIDPIVRRANPVPDVSMLDPVDARALLDENRRTEMQTLERAATRERPAKDRRGRWVAVAAAIAVAAAGVIIVEADDDSDRIAPSNTTAPPATTPPEISDRVAAVADG